MNTTMWTTSPADLLGLGGAVVPSCTGLDLRTVVGVSPAPRVAPVQGTGVPAGSAARLRPVFRETAVQAQLGAPIAAFAHNSIDGTTLGFHPSGRPLS